MNRISAIFVILVTISLSGCAAKTRNSESMMFSKKASGDQSKLSVCTVHTSSTKHWTHRFIKVMNRTQKFRSVELVDTLNDGKKCDIIVRVGGAGGGVTVRGDVFSRRTEKLLAVTAPGVLRKKVVDSMVTMFAPGGTKYDLVMAERSTSTGQTTVVRSLPLDEVDRPSYRGAPRPNDYAVVIGIEQYSELPKAQFAERDAAAVTRHLEALGIPRRNIKYLAGSKAGRSGFVKNIEAWLPRNVKSNSRVFFYFSGHGAPDVENGRAYLMPWDGDPNYLDSTAYPVDKLYAKLGALKAKEVVVILDSCFSGAGGRSVLAEGARPLVTRVKMGIPKGRITAFSAAKASQITATIKEKGHGIFTYYLLKGLNGAAKDSQGKITARSLHRYLEPKVEDEASRQNRTQSPTLRGASSRNLVFR